MATDAATATETPDFKPEPVTVEQLKAAADHAAKCWENWEAAAKAYRDAAQAIRDSEASYIELVKSFHRPPKLERVK